METAVGKTGPVWRNASSRVLLSLGMVILSSAATARAAVYFVDGNCPQDGNGLALSCASTTGGVGPKKTIDGGIALLSLPGDLLSIRGSHKLHDGETADFDGRYFSDTFSISGKQGSSAATIVVQPYNYSPLGTGESVYIDGTTVPSSGWSQCKDCSAGVCAGVPGTCGETWYATDSGLASKVLGAQKADGSPTYRVTSVSSLTNSHQGYRGTVPEIDSYSPQVAGATILVRWGPGTSAPLGSANPKPYVFYNNNGVGFWITNSSYITIQGFTFRCHKSASILMSDGSGPVNNISVLDNHILYNIAATGTGPDYGVALYRVVSAAIRNNEIGWTGSEGIHSQANHSGSALSVSGNWLHDLGDQNVLGTAASGTPSGAIFGDDGGFGDYSGSVFENNLITDLQGGSGTDIGRGLILENSSSNWIIRNNIWSRTAATCLKLDAVGAGTAHVDNNQIYNNLFLNCGTKANGTTSPGILAVTSSGKTLQNNLIYNNTFSGALDASIVVQTGGTISNNLMRNNIMYDAGGKKLVDWSSGSSSDVFENNVVYSGTLPSGSTLVTWTGAHVSGGPSYACAGITNVASSNKCSPPAFMIGSDEYHIQGSSPARDAGTSAGMPVGRLTSINNTLAVSHQLPSYADNQLMRGSSWDAGATEYVGSLAPTATLSLSDPSPTAAGNVTVTLSTSVAVISVPGPLSFLESDGTSTAINLSGSVPGSTFTGIFVVDSSVADGQGTFSLPAGSLVDSSNNKGNTIVSGGLTTIDKTPPSAPQNLRL